MNKKVLFFKVSSLSRYQIQVFSNLSPYFQGDFYFILKSEIDREVF